VTPKESIIQFYIEHSTDDAEEKAAVVQNLEATPDDQVRLVAKDIAGAIANFARRRPHADTHGEPPRRSFRELVAGRQSSPLSHEATESEEQPTLRLPDKPPENGGYKDRPIDPATGKKQGIQKYLEEGWLAPYVRAGVLTMTDLRRLEPSAALALYAEIRSGTALPDYLHLPAKPRNPNPLESADPEQMREAWRLVRAHNRAKARQREK
jgi:hypothetical protein